ncbi:M24 family metallopeptidase [Aquibacillus albus]|uniref:M24 family metallopeptidase n=1 Tax=Aquibacillus albus TaxID=1168171 RepID=UPI00195E0A2B
MLTRVNKLLDRLQEWNQESMFITSKANVYYISNHYTDPHERLIGIFIDKLGEPLLILPAMEKDTAIASGWQGDILSYADHENPWELFYHYLNKSKRIPNTIGIEHDHFTIERFEQIKAFFPETTTNDVKEHLANLRVIKDEKEYHLLKQAANLADLGVEIGIKAIEEGKTELEILATIEYELKKQGIREMSFATMVLTGNKTAIPHGTPGLDTIKPGDLVLFDLGVVFEGYCSDITRTVAYKQINDQQKDIYQTVLSAQKAAISHAKLQQPIGSLDQVARKHITDKGYGEYFTHRLGHGIGIDVHEFPSMTSTNSLPLLPGMSFTIEPGIYIPEIGGVRIEDQVLMTDGGIELLTKYPKELQIL